MDSIHNHPFLMQTFPPDITTVDLSSWFGPDGLLNQHIPAYEARSGQLLMAERVAKAMEYGTSLVVEGATGVGKTFAYLIAAMLSGHKAIIATETKLLQDQLANKDIPFLRRVFSAVGLPPISFAILKGRSNYVCLLEFTRSQGDIEDQQDLFESPDHANLWPDIEAWVADQEAVGGIAELDASGLDIPDAVKNLITTDSHRCLGKECPLVERCFPERAKRLAKQAQIIVVNTALLLIDAKLWEDTAGTVSLLPEHPVAIVDEAHALESVASTIFGADIGIGRWRWLQRQLERLRRATPNTVRELLVEIDQHPTSLDAAIWEAQADISHAIDAAKQQFDAWRQDMGDRSWMPIPDEVQALLETMYDVTHAMSHVLTVGKASRLDAESLQRWRTPSNAAEALQRDLQRALEPDPNMARFLSKVEGRFPRVVIRVVPIDVSRLLQTHLWNMRPTTIATSATLRTGGSFDYWMARVGLPDSTDTLAIASPFDYPRQARLFLPSPPAPLEPRQPGHALYAAYIERIEHTIAALLTASRGRALVLCTSAKAMQRWADHVKPLVPWRVLVQGDRSRQFLLQEFRDERDSILFATKSFWQGVDIAGESLSLLVIDKLPFASPDDPVYAARSARLDEQHGRGKSFSLLALPQMVLDLRQGIGRLIRRSTDIGVIAILDGRVLTKSYGSYILRSLPPASRVDRVEDVARFLAHGGDR